MGVALCIWAAAKSASFIFGAVSRGSWRHTSVYDVLRLVLAITAGSILGGLVIFLLVGPTGIPRSVYILDWLISCALIFAVRLAVRIVLSANGRNSVEGERMKTLIYGAGDAGLALLWELRQNHTLMCDVIGLIDDDPSKVGLVLNGKRVLGTGISLKAMVRKHAIKRVLIAIPSATELQMERILMLALDAGMEFNTIPGLGNMIHEPDLGKYIRSGRVTLKDIMSRLNNGSDRNLVLLIGGAGYIGSALLPKLLDNGYRVRLLDTFLYGDGPIAKWKGHPSLEIVEADFRRVDVVVRAMQGVKTVIHLGAIVGDPACALDEELTIETNLIATRMIAEVTKGEGIEKFIFASSCSVYGASDKYLNEHSELRPVSLYARSKIACEDVLFSMKSATFLPVILRFSTIYGLSGRTRFDLVVNLLTAKAMIDRVITVFGSDQWRPFLHVDDAALAVLYALQASDEAVDETVFNVGSDDQNYTLGDIGRLIKKMVPTAELQLFDNPNIDRRNYRVEFSRIRTKLNFKPKWQPEDGIQQIITAIRNGQIKNYKNPIYSNVRFLSEEIGPESLRMVSQLRWARGVLEACNNNVIIQ